MSKNDFKIFNFLVLCIILIGLATAVQRVHITFAPPLKKNIEVLPTPEPKLTYIPQFVLISFDGGKSIERWKDLRDLHDELQKVGKQVNYTFFFNAAYLLTGATKKIYIGPNEAPGKTNVGIADGIEDVRARIVEMNLAIARGDEIASHTTGHFSGTSWSKADWKGEFDSFDSILFGLDKLYPDAGLPKLNLTRADVIGFRAPYLDISQGLFEMLHDNTRYKYDSSAVSAKDVWPKKDAQGLWRIPLGTMYVNGGTKAVLAMDYNHYVLHSGAKDLIKKGTPEWTQMHDDLLAAWFQYFNRNYKKDRVPVLMGYHFGQWNDGLYWSVMKDFVKVVCVKPEVRCGTFKDLVNYLDEYGVPVKNEVAITAAVGDVHLEEGMQMHGEREQGEE